MKCFIIVILGNAAQENVEISTRKTFPTKELALAHTEHYTRSVRDRVLIVECPKGLSCEPEASVAPDSVTHTPVNRLFNDYSSTAGNVHADAIETIMEKSMDEVEKYIKEHNVCPRDVTAYSLMILTNRMAAYTLRRAFSMKKKEREHTTLFSDLG